MTAYRLEDIVNMGLRSAGVPLRIADIYEGSEAARTALEILGQTRDEIISITDWSFSRRVVALDLLKGPPPPGGFNPVQNWSNVYALPGFLFEYAYPDDMLDLRAIIEPPGLMPDVDPVPAVWRVDNDPTPNVAGSPPVASGPPAKVISTNTQAAIAVYRARVTDPSTWDVEFIDTLVASLGRKFYIAFGGAADAKEHDVREAAQAVVDRDNRG